MQCCDKATFLFFLQGYCTVNEMEAFHTR
jgi:hypothetical protein